MFPSQWIGLYYDGVVGPTFVVQCSTDYTPSCMHHHHLSMPLPLKCFMAGTHSHCLSKWENPTGEVVGFFHKVKSSIPLEDKRNKRSPSSMIEWQLLGGTQIYDHYARWKGSVSLTTPPNLGEIILAIK